MKNILNMQKNRHFQNSRRRLQWFGRIALLAIGMANAASLVNAQSVPQLTYMTRKGLDVQNNPIDRLINTFGSTCDHNRYSRKPCRFEKELVAFLKTLPANRRDITRELTLLGAVCDGKDERLHCIYERHVETSGWITGATTPVATIDEFLRINLEISFAEPSVNFEATLNRASQRRGDSDK